MGDTNLGVRSYARRDSATSTLRKLGVDKNNYSKFINKVGDKFECDLDKASEFVNGVGNFSESTQVVKPVKKRPKTKKPAAKKAKKTSASGHSETSQPINLTIEVKANQLGSITTVAGRARRLVLQGFNNEEIYEALQSEFGMERVGENKRHYPAWFRAELFRRGLIPPELKSLGNRSQQRAEVTVNWVDVLDD